MTKMTKEEANKIKYRANFLWGKEGKLEELLYEFANGTTEEYLEGIYKQILSELSTTEKLAEALEKIASMKDLTFAECSDAEFIIDTAKQALKEWRKK